MYAPIAFISLATTSIAAKPPLLMSETKSMALPNAVPSPHKPRREAYTKLRTSVAPVADTYTTRAFGNAFCNSMPVRAV